MNALQAYEAQVSSLARGMSRLEEELQAARGEKTVLLSDLASVRELCVKLDSSKELSTRQLTSKSMELERVSKLTASQSSTLFFSLHEFSNGGNVHHTRMCVCVCVCVCVRACVNVCTCVKYI